MALIGDGRNDENLIVAQLHVAFLRFHNAAVDWVRTNEPDRDTDVEVYLRARDLTRWSYQWLVVHDFLRTITSDGVVDRILLVRRRPARPRRSGHLHAAGVLGGRLPLRSQHGAGGLRLEPQLRGARPASCRRRRSTSSSGSPASTSRRSDGFGTRAPVQLGGRVGSHGRQGQHRSSTASPARSTPTSCRRWPSCSTRATTPEQAPFEELLKQLAVRNLLRGYRLSLPTGQAVARQLGLTPMTKEQLEDGASDETKTALTDGGFLDKTPLWFYVLKEAEVRARRQRARPGRHHDRGGDDHRAAPPRPDVVRPPVELEPDAWRAASPTAQRCARSRTSCASPASSTSPPPGPGPAHPSRVNAGAPGRGGGR